MLQKDTPALDFSLKDENGETQTLSAYQGGWVLLYFYPGDNTTGCTKEACELRDHSLRYEEDNLTILGVSEDSSESHLEFITKHKLPFTLLSDPSATVIEKYGAKNSDGTTRRISYLIDPEGIIEKVYPNVIPETHAREVLEDLEALR